MSHYRRLSSYIKSSQTKTMYKNGNRYECDCTVWTDKTVYSISVYNEEGKCTGCISTQSKEKANAFYTSH